MPEALARLLAQARRGGAKVPNRAGAGLTREGAFEVQERLAASFGPVGGFKVACPPDAPIVIAPLIVTGPSTAFCSRRLQIGWTARPCNKI